MITTTIRIIVIIAIRAVIVIVCICIATWRCRTFTLLRLAINPNGPNHGPVLVRKKQIFAIFIHANNMRSNDNHLVLNESFANCISWSKSIKFTVEHIVSMCGNQSYNINTKKIENQIRHGLWDYSLCSVFFFGFFTV